MFKAYKSEKYGVNVTNEYEHTILTLIEGMTEKAISKEVKRIRGIKNTSNTDKFMWPILLQKESECRKEFYKRTLQRLLDCNQPPTYSEPAQYVEEPQVRERSLFEKCLDISSKSMWVNIAFENARKNGTSILEEQAKAMMCMSIMNNS